MAEARSRPSPRTGLVAVLLLGTAVAVALGVLGAQVSTPRLLPVWWFTSMQSMKAWLSTVVLALVVGQLVTATWMYGRLPGLRQAPPQWIAPLHRFSGRAAFLLSLPVAFYCLYSFGFDTATPRVYAHSIAGCVFYGAFASKMAGLRLTGAPGWLVPLLGGIAFTSFVVAWYLGSVWWFQLAGLGR